MRSGKRKIDEVQNFSKLISTFLTKKTLQYKKDTESAAVAQRNKEADRILKLNRSLHALFIPNEFGIIQATISRIESLLEQGANIDYQEEKNKQTILMLATEIQNDQLTNYLLELGANPLVQDKNGNIASSSRYISSISLIRSMLKGYELLFSARHHNLKMLQLIIKQGADIHFRDSKGYTALIISVKESDEKIVEYLLSQNVTIFLELDNGEHVLQFANPKIRSLIIEALNPSVASAVDDASVYDDEEQEEQAEENDYEDNRASPSFS